MNLKDFEKLVLHRQSIRSYQNKDVSDELLAQLLTIAQHAPSPYNLQPTHYFVVKGATKKEALHRACFKQSQILEAPALVVFAGDKEVLQHNLDKILQQDVDSKAISEKQEKRIRLFVDLALSTKPFGFGYLNKLLLTPLLRLFSPTPELPILNLRAWLSKAVALQAMTFVLAAEAEGLSTCLMESFDESRVKKALGIPKNFVVPLIASVGYPNEKPPMKCRLPLNDVAHWI